MLHGKWCKKCLNVVSFILSFVILMRKMWIFGFSLGVCPMKPCNLVSSLKYLLSNGRRALLKGIRLGGSATFGEDEEPAKRTRTILFVIEIARIPLPGAPIVDRISSAVLRGVSHEGRLIKNKKAIETHELDRFRPPVWRNTLLMCSVGLYWLSYDITWDQMP